MGYQLKPRILKPRPLPGQTSYSPLPASPALLIFSCARISVELVVFSFSTCITEPSAASTAGNTKQAFAKCWFKLYSALKTLGVVLAFDLCK